MHIDKFTMYVYANGTISTTNRYDSEILLEYVLDYRDISSKVDFLRIAYNRLYRNDSSLLFDIIFLSKNWKINAYDLYNYEMKNNYSVSYSFIENIIGISHKDYKNWIENISINKKPFLLEMPFGNKNVKYEYESLIKRQGILV